VAHSVSVLSAHHQHQLPTDPLVVGADSLAPASIVRDLGIYVNSDLSMRTHILRTAGKCFAALSQIRSIRWSVTRPVLESLVVALVLSRLDYGCATLVGVPSQLLDRLQSAKNAAARLIFGASRHVHIMPLLRSLHWLPVHERIAFRLVVIVYCCLHGMVPAYLSADLLRVSDVGSRQRLRSATTSALVGRRTQRATIADRAFAAAAPAVWNSLPEDVRSSTSLPVFQRRLKTELYRCSLGPRHSV